MTYEEHIEKVILDTKISVEAYTYYVEYGWSLRKCALNMCLSHTWVQKYLEDLQYIDGDMYYAYKKEAERRRKR